MGDNTGFVMKGIAAILRGVIRLYRYVLQPVFPFGTCRFHPSCSEYAIDAIDGHGPVTGGWLAAKRIARCHPWGSAGFDPVPPASMPDHTSAPASPSGR